ncbi:MAG: DUF308 domain-containing protein [Microbacteriaceae bacterium]
MSTADDSAPLLDLDWLRRVGRGYLIALAIIGLLLGAIGLVFPGATLFTVAVLFGSFLVVAGMFRVVSATVSHSSGAATRWLSGIMGLLIVVTGIFTLAHPFDSLIVLALVIGIGWILDGVVDFVLGLRGLVRPRWFGFVSGILSMAAGVAMFVLPAAGVTLLVLIGSVLLIVVSVSTLLTLPRGSGRR